MPFLQFFDVHLHEFLYSTLSYIFVYKTQNDYFYIINI